MLTNTSLFEVFPKGKKGKQKDQMTAHAMNSRNNEDDVTFETKWTNDI